MYDQTDFSDAVERSCDVQHNSCADFLDENANDASFSPSYCDTQSGMYSCSFEPDVHSLFTVLMALLMWCLLRAVACVAAAIPTTPATFAVSSTSKTHHMGQDAPGVFGWELLWSHSSKAGLAREIRVAIVSLSSNSLPLLNYALSQGLDLASIEDSRATMIVSIMLGLWIGLV